MNHARKKTLSQSKRDIGLPHEGPGWLAAIVIALLTARFLLPTEASVDGETLWLVQLWILAAAVWAWRQVLRGRPMIHWDLGTLAVALLVVGHLVSGFVVFSRGGDKRAAVNVMWEWVSLGITFVIVRSVFAEAGARRTVIWSLTCVGVSLAGLGLYQHYVEFPRLAEEYQSNRAEFDLLQKTIQSGTASQRYARVTRARELHRWFVQREIPLEGPARKQWEARVLSSTEPFGTFGLANTLAGLLVVFLFPAVAVVMAAVRENGDRSMIRPSPPGTPKTVPRKMDLSPFSWIAPAGIVLLLIACLVLTKSRTAWVGGVAGGVVWWWTGRGERSPGRRRFGWAAAGVCAIAAIVVGVALTGGLDRKVLSESPKSLRYRWQYWTGTVGVLEELPLFGPGPGNFRQRYLKHKLPESSEEIRDPHNLVLDVWCNGGVISLAGLLLLFAWCGRGLSRRAAESSPPDAKLPKLNDSRAGIAGIVAGVLLVNFYVWFLDTGDVPRLWGLMAGGAAAWLLTRRILRTAEISTACLAGAGAALAVHLLGAGGIEMPAVTQLLLLLGAAVVAPGLPAVADTSDETPAVNRRRFAAAIVVTATAAMLFGTCFSTATIPVLTRQSAAGKGRNLWQAEGNLPDAERMFKAAADNDPLSPQPVRELAELAFSRWEQSPQRKPLLDRAIDLQKLAVGLDPHHFRGYWTLGRWYARRHEIGRKPDDVALSLECYAQAVERYPHNAHLLADYARILMQAGKSAAAAGVARRALDLDDLNRREGHSDKLLPREIRQRLLELVRKTERPAGSTDRN
jgi:O-antigen ligase